MEKHATVPNTFFKTIHLSSHISYPLRSTTSAFRLFWNTFVRVFQGDIMHSSMAVVLITAVRGCQSGAVILSANLAKRLSLKMWMKLNKQSCSYEYLF